MYETIDPYYEGCSSNSRFDNGLSDDLRQFAKTEGFSQDWLNSELNEAFPNSNSFENLVSEFAEFAKNLSFNEVAFHSSLWDKYILAQRKSGFIEPQILEDNPEVDLTRCTTEEVKQFILQYMIPIGLPELTKLIEHSDDPNLIEIFNRYKYVSELSARSLIFQYLTIRNTGLIMNAAFASTFSNSEGWAKDLSYAMILAGGFLNALIYTTVLDQNSSIMNHTLRHGEAVGHVLLYKGLRNLGVSHSEAFAAYMTQFKSRSELKTVYDYIQQQWRYKNAQNGFMIGGSTTTILVGEVNPILLGTLFFQAKNWVSKILNTFNKAKMTDRKVFMEWFYQAQENVDLNSLASILTGNKEIVTERLKEVDNNSWKMSETISKYSNYPYFRNQVLPLWIISIMNMISESKNLKIPEAFSKIGLNIGLPTVLSILLMQSDEASMENIRLHGVQALTSMMNQQKILSCTIEDAVQRRTLIQEILLRNSITFDPESMETKITETLTLNNEIVDSDITIQPGFNIVIGSSGSGKSTFLKFIADICEAKKIPYGLAPNNVFENFAPGAYFVNYLSTLEDPVNTHFGRYLVQKASYFKDMDSMQLKEIFERWAGDWIRNTTVLGTQNRRSRNNKDVLWDTKSGLLNSTLYRYLNDLFRIQSPEKVLFENGSEGEQARISIITSIQNQNAEFILIDEAFSKFDPDLVRTMLEFLNSLRKSDGTKPNIILCTHIYDHIEEISEITGDDRLPVTAFSRYKLHKTVKQTVSSAEDKKRIKFAMSDLR